MDVAENIFQVRLVTAERYPWIVGKSIREISVLKTKKHHLICCPSLSLFLS